MKFNFLKGKENPFSSENKRYHNNLLLFKNRIKTQNQYPVFVPKDITSEKIDKIKIKYSLSQNSINTQFVHRKIQFLKNKYMTNTQSLDNKFKINNTIRYSINNNVNNNLNLHSRNNIKKNMFRSTSLKLVKENNLKFNNLYNTLKNERKINLGENNKINDYIQPSKDSKNSNNNNKSKFQYNFKYLKNIKEDFINVHNKLKDLWQNDAFNKKKKKIVNMVFPISKKIYLLNEIKKDIKNVNKNSFGNTGITPKSTITSSSEYTNKNLFSELFSDEDNDAIMKKGGIKKPILIRNFTKPKLNLPKYRNLYNMKI
jgi:hypothetical protein